MGGATAAILILVFGGGILLLYSLGGGSLSGIEQSVVKLVAQAIAGAEGFGVAGAIPTLANNPGDLTAISSTSAYVGDTGQRMGSANIIVFDTVQDGWNALYQYVESMLGGNEIYSPSMTLAQAGSIYSGGSATWVQNVANTLGVDPSVTLAELSGQQTT